MTNPYRTKGPNWKPRTKKDYIDCIIESGLWPETKKKLVDMDIEQVRLKHKEIQLKLNINMMRKPSHLDNGTAQVGDTTKEGETHGT